MGTVRVENVIVLTTSITEGKASESIGHLNEIVNAILNAHKNPILVLGTAGDELLRGVESIEFVDIVFDPNYEGKFFSSLKAGCMASRGGTFAVHLSLQGRPDFASFEKIFYNSPEARQTDVICSRQNDAVFLVTGRGLKKIVAKPANSDFSKLNIHYFNAGAPLPLHDSLLDTSQGS